MSRNVRLLNLPASFRLIGWLCLAFCVSEAVGDDGCAAGCRGGSNWFRACGPSGRGWVRAEYLSWWMPGVQTPPLITTSTDEDRLGDLDADETTVLFGGGRIQSHGNTGFRLRAGTWLDCQAVLGVEASFFLVSPGSAWAQAGSSDGSTFVGRPFMAVQQDHGNLFETAAAQLVSVPGLGGLVDVRASSSLLGAELLLRHSLDTCIQRDLLVGFRYLNYSDRVTIREQLQTLDPPFAFGVVPGTRFDLVDSFRASNDFYGLTLGLDSQQHWGRWSLQARPQMHLGALDRRVSIRGQKTIAIPGQEPQDYAGGLLALETNMGDYRSSQFTVIPELDLQIGCQVLPRWRLLAGYSCLVFPGLARAGEQIDPSVNPERIPPVLGDSDPARPEYLGRRSTAWVHGVTAGLEFCW
jgi:hypothetical protein